MTRTCTGCGEAKSFDAFHDHPAGLLGKSNRCKDCKRKYDRARYESDRDRRLQMAAAWRAGNPGENSRLRAKWFKRKATADPQWARDQQNRANVRRRGKRDGEKAARRAREVSAVGSHSKKEWLALCRRWDNLCAYCGANAKLTRDHVIPLSRGGSHSIGNILPACLSCNSSKCDRLLIEWRVWKSTKIH